MTVHPFVRNAESAVDDIECGLLGILLFKPECLRDVADLLQPEMFLYQAHQIIYHAIKHDAALGRLHTIRTIESKINDGLFGSTREKREYLSGLLNSFASTMQARDYARSIVEFYNKRRLSNINSNTTLTEMQRAEQIAHLWREIGQADDADGVALGPLLETTLEKIGVRFRDGGGYAGIQTGLRELDNFTCGLEPGCLYVLAARPAMGKTALGLTMAVNIAKGKLPVTFFSLEMSSEQLAFRINARFSKVSMWQQRTARDVDFVNLTETRNALFDTPLTIIDKSGLTAEQICLKAQEIAAQVPQSLIIIDHLGIVAARDQSIPRVYQVAEMTMAFKCLAKELKVPVLLLHQLNRAVETRDDKRPGLSDLRDSGSIEQDADAVMMLYRAEYYLRNRKPEDAKGFDKWSSDMERYRNIAELIIAKNRQGKVGTAELRFDGERQCFEDLAQ